MRGTRKGLEGLGGLRNTEKGHNDEGVVSFLCMEQSTGAIAYPRKARPAASRIQLAVGSYSPGLRPPPLRVGRLARDAPKKEINTR